MVLRASLSDATWLLTWHDQVDPQQRQAELGRLAHFVSSDHISAKLPLAFLQSLTGRIPPHWTPEVKALRDAALRTPDTWWQSKEAQAFATEHAKRKHPHRALALCIQTYATEPLLASAISFKLITDQADLDWLACVPAGAWEGILEKGRAWPQEFTEEELNAAALRWAFGDVTSLQSSGTAIIEALNLRRDPTAE